MPRLVRIACLFVAAAYAADQGSAPSITPDQAHARKLAEIRKLMTLMGGDQMADQVFEQLAANLRTVAGPTGTQLLEEFRRDFDPKKIFEIQVRAYDKYLSAADVRAMLAFYESPAGRRILEAMPKIAGDMMQESTAMSRDLAEKARKRLQDAPPPKP